MRETTISLCERNFLLKSLENNLRLDGRAFDESRELKINFGRDWGCCHVSLGKTSVIAQVSCEVQTPNTNRPGEGILNLNIELSPLAAPHFEVGRQSDQSVQLNRLLEKCVKDSKAFDLESLCIKLKEKVWAVRVDVNVLNHEGNILDCASTAALAALAHFRRPDVSFDGEEIQIHTYAERDPIPTVLHHYPVCVSYAIFNDGDVILADPTLLEEGVSDGQIFFGLNSYKELCGMHLGGSSVMTPELIIRCANKAARKANTITQLIKAAVEEDKANRKDNADIGFQTIFKSTEIVRSAEETLTNCLNQWSTQKNKKIKTKASKMQDTKRETVEMTAEIESLGTNTAALIVSEEKIGEGTANAWKVSSEESENDEDEDGVVPDVPNEPVKMEIVAVSSGEDSEEEDVVVLKSEIVSPSRKTTKAKKRKKTSKN